MLLQGCVLGMEEFYSYKEKTLQKRQSRETKYNTTTTKKI